MTAPASHTLPIDPGALDPQSAADVLFTNLVHEIAVATDLEKKYGPDRESDVRIFTMISALFFITGHSHKEIRARAVAAAAEQPVFLAPQPS